MDDDGVTHTLLSPLPPSRPAAGERRPPDFWSGLGVGVTHEMEPARLRSAGAVTLATAAVLATSVTLPSTSMRLSLEPTSGATSRKPPSLFPPSRRDRSVGSRVSGPRSTLTSSSRFLSRYSDRSAVHAASGARSTRSSWLPCSHIRSSFLHAASGARSTRSSALPFRLSATSRGHHASGDRST